MPLVASELQTGEDRSQLVGAVIEKRHGGSVLRFLQGQCRISGLLGLGGRAGPHACQGSAPPLP
jgi:hypothetical protein